MIASPSFFNVCEESAALCPTFLEWLSGASSETKLKGSRHCPDRKQPSLLDGGHCCLLAGIAEDDLLQDSSWMKLILRLPAEIILIETANDITEHLCLRCGLNCL